MAKRRKPAPKPDHLAEWRARINAAGARGEARLLEHAPSAFIMVAQDDGANGIDTYTLGMGHAVEVAGLASAMVAWVATDSGIIVDHTDQPRAEAVSSTCREFSGLADHGLILVPACADGTEVYAAHWGSELVVHQVVKALAKQTTT